MFKFRFLGAPFEEVNLQDNISVKDAIASITKQFKFSSLEGKLVIPPSETNSGVILAPNDTLRSEIHQEIEIWRNPKLMKILFYFVENNAEQIKENREMLIDFTVPLSKMIPYIQRVLKLSKDQEFSLKFASTMDNFGVLSDDKIWLHSATSLEDQSVNSSGYLLVYPVAKIKKISAPITMKGWLYKRSIKKERSVKKERKTLKQKRLFALSEGFLFYFRKEKDSTPAGMISLEYYIISKRILLEKKKYGFLLSLAGDQFSEMTNVFKLQAENQEQLDAWYDELKRKCLNYQDHRVFGIGLKEILSRKSHRERFVPAIISDCINYLRTNSLNEEGLFRLSGSSIKLTYYKEKYDSGATVNLNDVDDHNVVAMLLKLYLRELPEPLFPFNYFSTFANFQIGEVEETCRRLRGYLKEFPTEHYNTARYLFDFLHQLSAHSDSTKMTTSNIAIVFGPTAFRSLDENQSVQSFQAINTLTEFLILHQASIFEPEEKKLILNKSGGSSSRLSVGQYRNVASAAAAARNSPVPQLQTNPSQSNVQQPPAGGGIRKSYHNSPAGVLSPRGGPKEGPLHTSAPGPAIKPRGGPMKSNGPPPPSSAPPIPGGSKGTPPKLPSGAPPRHAPTSSVGPAPTSPAPAPPPHVHREDPSKLTLENLWSKLEDNRRERLALENKVTELLARVTALEQRR